MSFFWHIMAAYTLGVTLSQVLCFLLLKTIVKNCCLYGKSLTSVCLCDGRKLLHSVAKGNQNQSHTTEKKNNDIRR